VKELDDFKELALKTMRYHRSVKKLSNDELFAAIDKNSDGRIEESEFLKFFQTCEKLPVAEPKKEEEPKKEGDDEVKEEPVEAKQADSIEKFFQSSSAALSDEDLANVFNLLDEDSEGFLSKVVFLRIVRQFMKIAKGTPMTEELCLKDSKLLRRMEVNEVIEVIVGPEKEDSANVARIKCKAVKDDLEGWVTLSGNEGSVFLKEGGNLFKVIKETIMTDSREIGEGKVDTKVKPRKLKEGEFLECREWPSKQEDSGLTRMMCKAKTDGRIGWATTLGNTGIAFIEQA